MPQESRLIISVDARNAQTTAENLNRELQNLTNSGNRADKQVNVLSSSLRSLAGYMAGVVTVSAAINKIDAYTNLQNRLKLVTNSQQELNQATQDTFKIAQNARQEWDSVVQVYQRFSDNAKTLGINMEQTAKLTDTVSKAVAISGASAASAEAALTQFGQALGTGTLRGEELNSVMEQTPALAKAIAQGMGITIGQLRTVAAEGKITSAVLVEALTKVADDVDQQFSKTDATIAQSFTQLSNATTQFVGEAGQASGAAQLLSGSISTLAQNLDLVANVAVIGGVAALTKVILAQTSAVYGSVTATIAQRAVTTAQSQANIAAAIAVTNEAKAHLANVLATNAEAQAKYGATAAATRYKLASDAVTQALVAQTAAQTAANATASIGARALALVGGPIGAITIGVTALSAGYMYLQSRTEEANRKLEEQASIATKTKNELLALEGAQKSSARTDLAAAFKAQNKELKRSDQIIGNLIAQIYSKNTADAETARILKEVREGTLTYDDAFKALNKSKANMPEIINKLRDEINSYEEARQKAQQNAEAQKTLGVNVELAGNAMQNAAGKARDKASAMGQDAIATRDAASANREYTQSLQQRLFDQAFITRLVTKHNKTQQEANLLLEAHKKTNGQISAQDKQLIAGITAQQNALDNYNKSQASSVKASRAAQSESKKQAKEAERSAEEITRLREQYTYAYADREKQIEINLQKELADIRKSGLDESYAEAASKRAYLEKQIYLSQLQFEINEFKMTEEQKLKYSFEIKQLKLQQNTELTDKNRKIALKALDEQYDYEVALSKIAKEERALQVREQFLTETQAMEARYDLELRKLIKIKDVDERNFTERMIQLKKQEEVLSRLQDAQKNWDEVQAEMSGTSALMQLNQTRFDRADASQNLFNAQSSALDQQAKDPNADLINIAAQREKIWQEHNARLLGIEANYNNARVALSFSAGSEQLSAFNETFKGMIGEQSTAFKAMFAAQKAFAIASVLLNAPDSYSKAYNAVVGTPYIGPYIAPVFGAMAVATQLAQASQLKSVNLGFQTGGYTGSGGVSQVAGVVHGQEYVLNAAATRRVGVDTLDAINNGGNLSTGSNVNITINVPQGYTATQTQTSDGITIDIVRQEAQAAVSSAFQNLNNANSQESRQITRNFNTTRAR